MTAAAVTETFKGGIALALEATSEHISRIAVRGASRRLRQLREPSRRKLQAARRDYEVDYEFIVPQNRATADIVAKVAALSGGVKHTKEKATFQNHMSTKGVFILSWKVAEPPAVFSDVVPFNVSGEIIPEATFETTAAQSSGSTRVWLLVITVIPAVLLAACCVVVCYQRCTIAKRMSSS